MKNFKKILFIIIIVILIIFLAYAWCFNRGLIPVIKEGVIVKVENKSLLIMDLDGSESLTYVMFADEGNIGFKEGQEVRVYFNGIVSATYPGIINDVSKIKITKEESKTKIPMEIVRDYNSSEENISITINDFTLARLSITMTDTNELPFEYSDRYEMQKKNKEAEKENQKREFDQNRVTPGTNTATRITTSSYQPEPLKTVWEVLLKLSNDSENLVTTENPNKGIVKKVYNFEEIYGILQERRI